MQSFSIVYFRVFIIRIYVLVCNSTHIRIEVESFNMNLTDNVPLITVYRTTNPNMFNDVIFNCVKLSEAESKLFNIKTHFFLIES